ncbi:glycosyltransferase family 4 protein [Terrabacter sp. NPDC000476]|uniref:glycosyltransferase family 4 protein n=1 Tax=Terrabacter sp. NPDC000476 TaxID=3154258 RepID=UPI00331F55C3
MTGATSRGNAARRLRQLRLLAHVAWRNAQDDPALLAVQAVRRLPLRARTRASGLVLRDDATDPSLRQALGYFLADRPAEVRSLLAQVSPRTAAGRRLAAELAVQVGQALGDDAPASALARAAWSRGDLTAALEVLEGASGGAARRQHARLTSDRRTMTPGFRLPVPNAPSAAARVRDGRDGGSRAPAYGSGSGPRVLHLLTNSVPRTSSGYALRSHSILRAQRAAGIEVEAVTRLGYPVTIGLPGALESEVVDGITYRRLVPGRMAPTIEERLSQTVEMLLPHVERFRPTAIHTTTHFPNALVAQAVSEATGVPWVYEVRGQLEKTWLASRPAGEQAAALQSERFRLCHDKETEMSLAADHVVVLSEALRRDLVERGVPAGSISVMPNAVDEGLLSATVAARDARRALGLPADGFWVGTVSSLVAYEGIDVLVDAVALLRARGLDVRCAVVGDGTARPALQAQVDRLGLSGVVVLPGRVDRTEAAAWHRALDVFVVPRQDVDVCRTVTPLKPIEAMAAGRPVVASDLPALAEIVAVPGTGLLARPEDAQDLATRLQTLLDDEPLRRRLGDAGRAFAATRTWQGLAARYRNLYEHLGSDR